MNSIESTSGVSNAATPQTAAVISSDFETFIRMLTVQAENQDPLNPMDSSEYAMQLATFSAVEQQVLTNDLLSSLIASAGQSNLAQLAQWVGMEGQTTQPVGFSGSPIGVVGAVAAHADQAELVIYDDREMEVARVRFDPQSGQTTWDGTLNDTSQAPDGNYRFEIESTLGETVVQTSAGSVWRNITEAHRSPTGIVVLTLAGGTEVTSENINGVRLP